MDVMTPQQRKQVMGAIRSRNTQPEIAVRRIAHSMGLRFRLHREDLPGSPDIVFPRWHVALFVHGCFWHRHSGCRLAAVPKTRPEFWASKFQTNIERDRRAIQALERLGWRVLVVWECETRSPDVVRSRLRAVLDHPACI